MGNLFFTFGIFRNLELKQTLTTYLKRICLIVLGLILFRFLVIIFDDYVSLMEGIKNFLGEAGNLAHRFEYLKETGIMPEFNFFFLRSFSIIVLIFVINKYRTTFSRIVPEQKEPLQQPESIAVNNRNFILNTLVVLFAVILVINEHFSFPDPGNSSILMSVIIRGTWLIISIVFYFLISYFLVAYVDKKVVLKEFVLSVKTTATYIDKTMLTSIFQLRRLNRKIITSTGSFIILGLVMDIVIGHSTLNLLLSYGYATLLFMIFTIVVPYITDFDVYKMLENEVLSKFEILSIRMNNSGLNEEKSFKKWEKEYLENKSLHIYIDKLSARTPLILLIVQLTIYMVPLLNIGAKSL